MDLNDIVSSYFLVKRNLKFRLAKEIILGGIQKLASQYKLNYLFFISLNLGAIFNRTVFILFIYYKFEMIKAVVYCYLKDIYSIMFNI